MQGLKRKDAEAAVRRLLVSLGHDPNEEGLKETPRRVVSSFVELTSGYLEDPEKYLRVTFKAKYDQVVALADIPFVSVCEHHLLPFRGHAGVAYIPNGRVVGLSKLARVVDVYSRRLQLQEQLTEQIADALEKHLSPKAVAVVMEAEHSCMTCRGVKKTGAMMRTSALRGGFQDDAAARSEALRMLERRVS